MMKIRSLFVAIALLSGLGWFAGCASPDRRIRNAPELFAKLPEDQQKLVREGKVGVGFSQDAVKLAVGEPDRIWTRTDASGTKLMWSYTSWTGAGGQRLYSGWYHQSSGALFYSNYPDRREAEYLKLIFDADGRVAEIEHAAAR